MNYTVALIFLPLIAGVITFFVKNGSAKYIALVAALMTLVLTGVTYHQSILTPNFQFDFTMPWVETFGINFHVGMDGISLLLVMLTSFLIPLIILSAFRKTISRDHVFYALILIMQSALIGVFVARDAFLFYVFWELALIPIYFICLMWGGENKNAITFKFFIYTLAGSLIMLLGIIYVYILAGSFEYDVITKTALDSMQQTCLFWAFFIAFAIKMPIFPLHTWQPSTYFVAPAQGTMLLSGIMLKMGVYGVIRWILPITPLAVAEYSSWVIGMSVIGIVYASVIAIMQNDFKKLIAYSSIAHVGLIAAGIFTFSYEGIQGAIVQMLSHGLTVVGLFFIIDILNERVKSTEFEKLGGLRNVAPQLTIWFVVIMLGSVALPLTSGFVGEFMLFVGVFQYNGYIAAIAGLSIILGAVYMLNSFQKIMLGEVKTGLEGFKDLYLTEKVVLIAISFFVIYMGVFPKTFLELSDPAVRALLDNMPSQLTLK